MDGYRQPDFISAADHPSNRIRCPIHGFIHYSDNERRLINHPLFQRLRYIRQLALTELVYPGANHTRFEHSLGVMHVATLAFDTLARKNGNRLESEFKTVAGLETKPLAIARQLLRLAALLHDLGHAAFSHAAEEAIFKGDLNHESLSITLISQPAFLGALIDGLFGEDFSKRVALLLQGPPELPPQLQVLKDIVSGEMDADRTDYLLRDSLHCGVDYGRFDHRRLIESIELDDSAEKLELALNRDGLHAFEALILARYQMNTQVYYHRLRRIYDNYLVQYHGALGPSMFDSAEKIVGQTDTTMLARMLADSRGDSPASAWACRIVNRDHHKIVFEPGDHVVSGTDLLCAQKVFKDVQQKYDDVDFVLDSPKKPISFTKLLMPTDAGTDGVNLMLISSAGEKKPLARSSQILSTVPKSFRPIRIFGSVDDKRRRREIWNFAATRWSSHGGTS